MSNKVELKSKDIADSLKALLSTVRRYDSPDAVINRNYPYIAVGFSKLYLHLNPFIRVTIILHVNYPCVTVYSLQVAIDSDLLNAESTKFVDYTDKPRLTQIKELLITILGMLALLGEDTKIVKTTLKYVEKELNN